MKIQAMLCTLIVLSFVVGCKADKSNDVPSKRITSSIINGQKADENSDQDLILSIVSVPQQYVYCTGILISSNVVLTAAHCIEKDKEPSFIFLGKTAPFYQDRELENDLKYSIEKIIIHPSYSTDYKINGGNDDLAILILKEKVRAPFKAMKINEDFDFIKSGTPLHVAGFSIYSAPLRNNIFELFNVKLAEKYKPSNFGDDDSIQFLTRNVVINSDIKPNVESDTIGLDQIAGGICPGDSGGPTMIKNDNQLLLVGINRSIIDAVKTQFKDCEFKAKSTSVAFHKNWINEAISEAQGELPEFVTSKNIDSKELQCGKIIGHAFMTYLNLQRPGKATCSSLTDTDAMESMISLDEECQEKCRGVKGFEGQCEFFINGAVKMQESYKTKCEARLK